MKKLIKKFQTGDVIQPNNERVKEFFEYDVLPRYMKYHPEATEEDINKVKSAYTHPAYKKYLGTDTAIGGQFDEKSGKVYFNELYNKIPLDTQVHEYGHELDYLKGIKDWERELTNQSLSINNVDDPDDNFKEKINSYRLARFKLWNDLYNKSGQRPTLEQTDSEINKQKRYKLEDLFQDLNGYDIQVKDVDKAKEGVIKLAHHYIPTDNNMA